jgi:hypothetical protein
MAALFETLESRQLLATFTVLNTNDAGAGSLRQAIVDANALAGADLIEFADEAVGVITLVSPLSVTGNLTITGRDGLEISGGDTTRVFEVTTGASASFTDLTISNGSATSAAGILNAGSLTLSGVTISDNAANNVGAGAGGGILNNSTGVLILTNCLIQGNSATGTSSGNGAGISNSGTLTVTNSTISSNTATSRGGGILNTGTATILGSTFSNNLAYNVGGGAIMDLGGELQIINSTLSGNGTDADGGAVHLSLGSAAEIHNSTVTANNALDLGDGLYIDSAASLLLTSSIVAANGTADIAGNLATGSINNLVKDDTENGGLVNAVNANLVGVDPLLGALAENGGPTQTHAILAGSPAINAGANASGQATTDQRGPLFARVGAPDIGAYEILTLALVVDSLSDTEDGDFSAGNISLREAIAATNGNPGADSITFAEALAGQTVLREASGSTLTVEDEVNINGPTAGRVTLDANSRGSVFLVESSATLRISGLVLTNGRSTDGAGIDSQGVLEIDNCIITGNSSSFNGGAIAQFRGSLTVTNSTLSNNSATDEGGAIWAVDCNVTLTNCTFDANESARGAGVYLVQSDAALIGDCTFSGNVAREWAGGLWTTSSTVVIENTTFDDNSSAGRGGGMFFGLAANVTMSQCTISNNSSDDGGGVFSEGASLVITNSSISGNTAAASGGARGGGGLFVGTGDGVTIEDCTISGNQAAGSGAGVYLYQTAFSSTISNSTISANIATGGGGGVACAGTQLSITDSDISQNSAGYGGAFLLGETNLSASRCRIESNSASGDGGGFFLGEASLTIVDSLVHMNTARDGGGIAAFLGATDVTIVSSTLSSNTASRVAGAIACENAEVELFNCTIVNNTAPDTGGVFNDYGTLIAISTIIANNTGGDVGEFNGTPEPDAFAPGSINNLIGDAATAGGLTNGVDGNLVGVDPLLGPLANNGGPTRTHRLLAGSPAINTGANPDALTTDQRGFQRVRGTAIDIGAVEFIGGPSIATFTPPTSSLPLGLSALLTANGVADPDGSVAGVRFYLDANSNGIGEPGELLFNDTNAADGFKYLYETDSGDSIGSKRFLAIGYDEDGTNGAARLATVSVTEPASIGSPVGSANSVNVHRVATVNTIGHVLVYRQGWTYEDLTEKTGAPIATSPAITWVDPKNGLAFVAATSASGLLLFTRSASGTWSFRNLSTETGATTSPSGNLTHFISKRQRIVVIAGITDAGRVVAFRQALTPTSPGVHAYSFVDISADLESQGQTTPALTGLTSYVPKWDTWHLAGVDTMGRIQSIWINTNNPAFTKWRTDNLSNITGAPALAGQLAVTLTAWGGINLTGLDSSGNMLTTWWVPRFGGQWAVSNLTTRYSGPQLVGGNLTAYTTPWGGINYVGLDSTGDVRVYWWVPSFGGTWAISRLLPSTTPDASVPTGRLTSHASAAGTLNVFGTNASGDLLRLAWQPGTGSAWAVENLSEIAVEA